MSRFGFGFGAPVMGPLAGFGANNGRVMQSRRLPAFAPVPDQAFATDPTLLKREEAMRAEMALRQQQALAQQALAQQASQEKMAPPPQAPAPAQQMPASPIRAPKDRGMFGRFMGILANKPYGGEQMGWVERLGRGPEGMNAVRDEIRAGKKTAEEEARRQQALGQLNLSPQEIALTQLFPEQAAEIIGGRFKPAAPVKGEAINNRLVNFYTGEEMGNFSDPVTRYRPLTAQEAREFGLPSNSGYQVNETTNQIEAVGRENAPLIGNLNTGANGPEIGTIPQGFAAVIDLTNPSGYRLEAIPGGPAGTEAQGAATARKSLENTFRTLFLNYSDLSDKGAIRDSSKGVTENLSAYAQSTPLGREVGKVVGSPAEAMRETIEALQPAISQAIMSQPGMSARSMDSERELQFFIRSITAPTADVWANYATLHALDSRFGSGQLMNSLLQSGEITQADYDKITRSPRVAVISGAMDAKINELFASEQGMADTVTPEEAAELEELRRWKKDRGIP